MNNSRFEESHENSICSHVVTLSGAAEALHDKLHKSIQGKLPKSK